MTWLVHIIEQNQSPQSWIGLSGSIPETVNIEQIIDRKWHLARYVTSGKNRELLFSWLNERHATPWTPLIHHTTRRADSPTSVRRRIQAVFPGYFFIRVNLDVQSAADLSRHSAFVDFVRRGRTILPVQDEIVSGLMKIYPDPSLNPYATEELNAASRTWLSDAQYRHLLRLEQSPQPESRIAMLLNLVTDAGKHGFSK